jgi:hypothetical protein
MRYEPPKEHGGLGLAEMIVAFIICLLVVGYLFSLFIKG